jgi:hypothetical protein
METVLGFVAGYLAGCQDGKDGVKRLRESLQAILRSEEVRRLTAEALTVAQASAKRAMSSRSFGDTVGTVTDVLAHRARAIAAGNRAG